MRCKNCNSRILEGEQFCRKCGHRSPLAEQRDRIANLRAKLSGVLIKNTHSPLLVIIAIIFTVMTLARPLSIIYWDYLSLVESVFMIISTVGLWMCFAAKGNRRLAIALRTASIHDAYVRVVFTTALLFVSILFIGGAIVAFVGAGLCALSKVESVASVLPASLITLGIVVLVIGGIILFALTLVRSVFAGRRKYFVSLAELAGGSKYREDRSPALGSFLLGGAGVFFGVASLVSAIFLPGITSSFIVGFAEFFGLGEYIGIDMSGITNAPATPDALGPTIGEIFGLDGFISIDDTGILGWIAETVGGYINYFASVVSIILAVVGVCAFVFGIYFILSGALMSSIHNEARRICQEIDRESAIQDEMLREMRKEAEAEEVQNEPHPSAEPVSLIQHTLCEMQNEEPETLELLENNEEDKDISEEPSTDKTDEVSEELFVDKTDEASEESQVE